MSEPHILTIDSEYCAMGRWISIIVGQQTGLPLLEGRELCHLTDQDWLTPQYLADFDDSLAERNPADLPDDPDFQLVSGALTDAVRRAAEAGPCIIHERAASHVLHDRGDVLSVMVRCSDQHARFPRAKFDPHFPELVDAQDAAVHDRITREDRIRAAYHDAISPHRWGEASSYDLCLDSGRISREKCAEILIEAMRPVQLDAAQARQAVDEFTRTWTL